MNKKNKILIFLIGLFFIIVISLIDSLLTDRGLRDLMKIAKKEGRVININAVLLALAYSRLGMKRTLKLLNGVYDPDD